MDEAKPTPRAPYSRRAISKLSDLSDLSDISERVERSQRDTEKQDAPTNNSIANYESFKVTEPFPKDKKGKLPPFIQRNISLAHYEIASRVLHLIDQRIPEAGISMRALTSGNKEGYAYHYDHVLTHGDVELIRGIVLSNHSALMEAYLKKLAHDFFTLCHLQHLDEFDNGPIESCIPFREIKTAPKKPLKNLLQNLRIVETININGLERFEVLVVISFMCEEDISIFTQTLRNLSNPKKTDKKDKSVSPIAACINEHTGYCRIKREDWLSFQKALYENAEAQALYRAIFIRHRIMSQESYSKKIPVKKLATPAGLLALEISEESSEMTEESSDEYCEQSEVLLVVDTSTKEKRTFLNTVLTVAIITYGEEMIPQKIDQSNGSSLFTIKKEHIQKFRALWAQNERRGIKNEQQITRRRKRRRRRNGESSGRHQLAKTK